jgi:hypothetical protein
MGIMKGADVGSCRLVKSHLTPKEASEMPYSAIWGSLIRQDFFCALYCPNYIRLLGVLLLYIK